MDVYNNAGQQHAAPNQAAPGHKPTAVVQRKRDSKFMRILSVIILVCVGVLIGLVALYLAIGGSKDESKYVDKNRFQAVFLNGGQVYFGKVHTLNNSFVTIDNIYYLRVNNQQASGSTANSTSNQDVSLAKLGCELHGPTDSMVINRDQVLFWENLKDDGQVVKAITAYVKANPQGQKCDTSSNTTTNNTPATNNTSTDSTKK